MNIYCPHCQINTNHVIFPYKKENNQFDIVKCENCGHLYTWIDEEIDVEDLYSTEAYKLDDQRNSIFFKIQKYEYVKMLKKALSFIKKQDDTSLSILDFGSGKGHLLYFAQQLGFKPFGVETADERAAFAKEKYNLPIVTEYYPGSGKIGDGNFDVITLIHVLEHLPEPELIIGGLFNDNLNKNGILVIEVPNISSWQSKIGGAQWLHLDLPRHINHYSPKYLSGFLKSLNGEILKKETLSFHHGIIGMLQSLMSLFGYKKSLIVDLKFNRSAKLIISVLLLVLPAFLLEITASIFGKGGMIRMYLKK